MYEGLLVRLPSLENNSRCGSVEGWLGQRWEYSGGGEACAAAQLAAGRREQVVPSALVCAARAGIADIEEARWPLDGHPTVTACASTLFLGKRQICGKHHTAHLPLFLIIYSPFANS